MSAEDETPVRQPGLSETDLGLAFDQYRLAVEMADRVSARRGAANAFFLGLHTALLPVSETLELWLAALLGIVLCGTWWLLLRSYRQLNAAKWGVINGFESDFPRQPFLEEWNRLKEDPVKRQWLTRYAELSAVEQIVPGVLALLYALVVISAVV